MEDGQKLGSARAIIDPDGDLVLVIEGRELVVSRKALCLSSSVFRAMLRDGSPFLESTDQVIASDGLRRIQLKEDNYEAMSIVAKVIHMQHDIVPVTVSFNMLETLAVACDKYDIRQCLGFWPQKWSEPHFHTVTTPGYERWLFIAFIFRNATVFSMISQHFMLNTKLTETGDLQFPGSNQTSEGVPNGILEQIGTCRATAAGALLYICQTYFDRLCNGCETPVCSLSNRQNFCDSTNLGCLIQTIPEVLRSQVESYQYPGNITQLIPRIRSIACYGGNIIDKKDRYIVVYHTNCGLSVKMSPAIEVIMSSMKGLSLPPLKSPAESS